MARILRHVPDMENRYFRDYSESNESKLTVAYLVITSDKGMAGAYNQNILKLAKSTVEKNDRHKLFVLGEMGRHYCMAHDIKVDEHFRFDSEAIYGCRETYR